MKEFETCSSNEKVIFNNLCAVRNPIECAFGRLKARWSIPTRKMDLKLESIPVVVYACFILHNFCEKNNSFLDETLVTAQIDIAKLNQEKCKNLLDPVYSCDAGEGKLRETAYYNIQGIAFQMTW